MERREDPRRARRLRVSFWVSGEEKHRPAFTTNISTTGMFIATNYGVSIGTRLRVQIFGSNNSFMVEAVAVRTVRVSATLQSLKQAGIGARFLTIKELVEEMIPELAASGATTADDQTLPQGTYRLRFPSKQKFLTAYRRDISTGGIFLPTNEPAALNDVVTVQLEVARSGLKPIQLQARVVHCLEQDQLGGTSNLIAGMGLELLNPGTDLERTRVWAKSFE